MSKQLKNTAVIALAMVAFGWSWAAAAQGASRAHASNVSIPLSAGVGITVSNVGPNCNASDTVSLLRGSRVHVLAIPMRNVVHANLRSVRGTGNLGDYVAVGAQKANLGGQMIPPDGTGTLVATAQFKLFSTEDHCASQPLPVRLNLVFSGGVLQKSLSTACVAGTSGC